MIIAIILVILIFGGLIFVHELGHFVAARINNVEVEEFGFGFPPRLFGRRVGRTLYSVNLLPLGGFVRLRGEDQGDKSPGTFGGASLLAKTKILLAGVLINALSAYLILLGLCFVGLPAALAGDFKLPSPSTTSIRQVIVVQVGAGSPAAAAGLSRGDVIVTANGVRLNTEADLVNFTAAHAGEKVNLKLSRRGRTEQIAVRLRSATDGRSSGYLGVTPFKSYNLSYGWRSVWVAASLTGQMIWATLAGFAGIIAGLVAHHGGPAPSVTGPVGIVVILSNIMYLGFRYVLFFVATISVSLAVINTLPIPAIDGGRLFLIWLGVLRRKPISPQLEAKIHNIGFVALIALMVMITILDVGRIGK